MFKNVVEISSNKFETWNGEWNVHICVESTSVEWHNCPPSQKLQINTLLWSQIHLSYQKTTMCFSESCNIV